MVELNRRWLPASSAAPITASPRCGRPEDRRSRGGLAPKVVQVHVRSRHQKFEAFGLTPVPAERVRPPLVAECFANIECRVTDTRMVNRYNIFILEGVKAWIDPKQRSPKTIHHRGYGAFVVDGETIKLKSKMP
jgi:flavin reductase (DIM6/NTAB) family NADH-FMN oxidoreductase RutF